MQINMQFTRQFATLLTIVAVSAALSACTTPAPRAAPPAAKAPVISRPVAPPLAETPNWRDAPLTNGDWTYAREGTATVAAFTTPEGLRLFSLTCHRERGSVVMSRAGSAATPVPASIVTSYTTRPFSITPLPQGKQKLVLSLRPQDPVLDEIAFSRGRFVFEVNGLPTLYMPAHAEIGRVIEDCRSS